MIDKKNTWKDVLELIKVSVSPAIFSTWFLQTHLTRLNDLGERISAEVGCSSFFAKTTLENRYFGLVQDSLVKTLGKPCDLTFIVKDLPKKFGSEEKGSTPLFEGDKENWEDLLSVLRDARVKPGFTFENFAVSSSNQMAWAASEAVSKNPGNAYNPLFLWGGVGVGKTHLMNSIGFSILQKNKRAKVYFCTGEDFTNDIVEGIRNKTTQTFRNKYRKLDALFVDDIQFIAGKDAVQEEFFHTFNAVTGAGGQVVLTSDQPPSEISKLEERLRSRFEAGLIVDIGSPDFELRCAILQIKSKERGVDLSADLVQTIASNVETARKLEGFLVRLSTEINVKGGEPIENIVQTILGKGIESNGKTVPSATTADTITQVSIYFSISKKDLLGERRSRAIAVPRQILMYLLRTHLRLPLEEVGRIVGGRDHTTVMHAVEKITNMAASDVQTREDILGIKNKL